MGEFLLSLFYFYFKNIHAFPPKNRKFTTMDTTQITEEQAIDLINATTKMLMECVLAGKSLDKVEFTEGEQKMIDLIAKEIENERE